MKRSPGQWMIISLRRQLKTEKALRIKYRGLVYAACRLVDRVNSLDITDDEETIAGTTVDGLKDNLLRVGTYVAGLREQLEETEAKAEFEGECAQAWYEICREAQKRVAESQQNWMLQRQQLNDERRLRWEAERKLKQTSQTRRTALEEAAALVDRWAMSYPTSVFPAPPPGQHAETVDGCSAAALRSVLSMVAAGIRALAGDSHPGKRRLVWCVDETDDGRVLLTAPDGTVALHVDKGRAEMLGRMLLGAVGDEDGYIG